MIMISKSLILRDHIPHRCVGPLMCVDLCSDWSGVCFRKPYPLLPSGTCSFRVLPHGPSWEPSRVVRQHFTTVQFSSVQFSRSVVSDSLRPHELQHARSLSITNSQSSLKLTSIESVLPSSHLILCRPLFLLPPIPPSIKVFSNESALCMRRPKYWSFSFSIIPSKEHPGRISFRMDWLDLLIVQGTLKSLLQNHSLKASILLRSAFFTVQLSHPYVTTGKTIALTKRTFVGKVMSLLFQYVI